MNNVESNVSQARDLSVSSTLMRFSKQKTKYNRAVTFLIQLSEN